MVFAHVIYKKTGQERKNVTPKAYNLLKNQYTLLGWVDEKGNPTTGPETQSTQKTQKKSAAVVASEPKTKLSEDEIAAKKLELKAMNDAAIKKAKDEQAAAKKEAAKKAKEKPSTDAKV